MQSVQSVLSCHFDPKEVQTKLENYVSERYAFESSVLPCQGLSSTWYPLGGIEAAW
eukprot:SAG31_NODE_33604_length_342_cov_0.613169_1_plen_55_part_10